MTDFEACWQKELANSFTEPQKLLEFLQIPTENHLNDIKARQLFPMRVPRPFAARMAKADIKDPLFKQVWTSQQEFEHVEGFVADPLGEHQAAIPGLLHKYKSRVLLMVKTGCAVNCRYCFRREFPYQDNSIGSQDWQAVIDYIQSEPEVNEVVLSGGDPLMAKDKQLIALIERLAELPQLSRLRIHTRLPVVVPQRITAELTQCLQSCRLKVIVVFHINHAAEIDQSVAQAIEPWRHRNITLLNQAVLLRYVNDNLQSQVRLSERLFEVGVLPYYLHLLDRVTGVAHFEVAENNHLPLYEAMLAELPGFLMPKWVREVAGQLSKRPATC